MPYYIRKKSTSTWTHGQSEIIISKGYFKVYKEDSIWIFELTEEAGSDNVKQKLTDIILVDETDASTEETFTDGVVFANRLKSLAYPFFKSASGGSGAVDSVFGRTGDVTASSGDYSLNQISDVTISNPTNNQVVKYNTATNRFENQDEAGGGGIPDAPDDGSQYARQNESWSVVLGGDAKETESFTTVIKSNKKYYSCDNNRGTQTAIYNFTLDDTEATIEGGGLKEFLAGDFAVNFNGSNWGSISIGNLTLNSNQFIPDEGVIYRIIFFWNGSKMDVAIAPIEDIISIPQLNAPVLTSVSEGSSAGELDLVFTDPNSSPNESGIEVYYKRNADLVYSSVTISADLTTYTLTGLSGDSLYNVYLRANGAPEQSNDSDNSNIVNGTTSSSVIPLFIDEFNGTTIDTAKWTLSDVSSLITQNDEIIFTEPVGGSNQSAFMNTNNKFNIAPDQNPILAIRVSLNQTANASPPRFSIALKAVEGNGAYLATNLGNNDNLRLMRDYFLLNSSTFINTAVSGSGEFKIVMLDTGVTNTFKWDSVGETWGTSLGSLTNSQPQRSHYLEYRLQETGSTYTDGNTHASSRIAVYDTDFTTLNP